MSARIEQFFGKNTSNSKEDIVIRIGEVWSVDDDFHGGRIKVKLDQDNNLDVNEIPYAFPLLPKTFQSVPKVGEAVLIILSRLSNKNSIRYYIGPLISQPQKMTEESCNGGLGSSNSLLKGSTHKPLETIDHYASTRGSFPQINDVALVGRKSEDVILKEGEIDIRCGIRGEKYDADDIDENVSGNVHFNTIDPSYIQLKYQRGLCKGGNSVVNLVADKINLISHQDSNCFNLTDQDSLIPREQIDDIMEKLHPLPYGDVLMDCLLDILSTFGEHRHAYPGLPPSDGTQKAINATILKLNGLLSPHVRTS